MRNVSAVVGNGTDVGLPDASVDLAYLSDVYHHFEHPAETLASIRKALKPGGRMVVIDYERIPGSDAARRASTTLRVGQADRDPRDRGRGLQAASRRRS